jgi:hypothetical protein
MTTWLDTLATRACRVYSQTGEEGILAAIFEAIGTTNKYLVDIGAGDGTALSNTRLFLEQGWRGARFDSNYAQDVHQERITAENICDILAKYNVPGEFDFLSLDIDGVDWYVLRALLRNYHPRVFVCEINNSLPTVPPLIVEYHADHVFENCDYFGASLGAYSMLAEKHGYVLVHCLPWNAFFVQGEFLPVGVKPEVKWAPQPSWPRDPKGRPWHAVTGEDLL